MSTVALYAADLGHQGTEPGAKAGLKFFWCIPFADFPAVDALAPVKDEMDDCHRNFGQLDVADGYGKGVTL
ncbi:hypothetical protein [Acinetobacter sp.]|uniref:hypothetical protein n=1 Tax=Acinetobacter sp. TaxID=472 RepID=UPI003D01A1AD